MQPELIADCRCETGEGPLWHRQERRLYWTDIPTGRMFRYDPATGGHEQFHSGEAVGGFGADLFKTTKEYDELRRRIAQAILAIR